MDNASLPVIVLIDDSSDEAVNISLIVEQLHVPVRLEIATDIITGIQLVRNEPRVRLILLDVHMPGGDGRWAVTEIQKFAPQARIIPYTADYQAARQLEAFGCAAPIYKPALPPTIAGVLSEALAAPPPLPPTNNPMYGFIREQAPGVIASARSRANRGPLCVCVVARSAMHGQGLRVLIEATGAFVVSDRPADIRTIAQKIDVIVCTIDSLDDAERIANLSYVPLLAYATSADVLEIPPNTNLVIEPVSMEKLTEALRMVAAGGQYGVLPEALAALDLSSTQQRLIRLMAADVPNAQIVSVLGVTPNYLRHMRSQLYQILGLEGQEDLRVWAKTICTSSVSP
jgi:CheY-like chemotaxis protein/DNA-binding CsgD family transcriptional regulator